jgi:hypothetical protein
VTNVASEGRLGLGQNKIVLWSIFGSLLVGAIAVTNQSLWIDEANSAAKAIEPSLKSWWTTFVADRGSDLQMPFYMFYLWAWAKIVGTSEVALRAANIPWFAIGVWALLWGFTKQCRLQVAITVLAFAHAFLWYYISEARPYVVLFAFSALTAACLFRLREDREDSRESPKWFQLFCLGIVGLCATNLIAVPWAIGALGAFLFWVGPKASFRMAGRSVVSSGLSIIILAILGLYYLWTLKQGARASDIGRTGLTNMLFVLYELSGLGGLGPGRLVLREEGVHSFSAYVPAVGIGFVAAALFLSVGFVALWKKAARRDFIFFALAVGIPIAGLMFGGIVTHMRLLGRHFTPLLPFLLPVMGLGLQQIFFAPAKWIRLLAVAGIAVLLISALEIRFSQRHQRDNYRTAAGQAQDALAHGETVWWLADESGGRYYGLDFGSEKLVSSLRVFATEPDPINKPDLIFLSKPDIYDPNGNARRYLVQWNFKLARELTGFRVFEKPVPNSY